MLLCGWPDEGEFPSLARLRHLTENQKKKKNNRCPSNSLFLVRTCDMCKAGGMNELEWKTTNKRGVWGGGGGSGPCLTWNWVWRLLGLLGLPGCRTLLWIFQCFLQRVDRLWLVLVWLLPSSWNHYYTITIRDDLYILSHILVCILLSIRCLLYVYHLKHTFLLVTDSWSDQSSVLSYCSAFLVGPRGFPCSCVFQVWLFTFTGTAK